MSKFLSQLGSVPGISALAVAGIGAVVGIMATCVVKTMSWGKSLDDVMKLLGVTSKEAAGLKLIADATGVSIETLTKGLDIMGKNLVTVDGKLGTAGKALKSLGINIYDANGQLKRTPDLLSEVADKMAKMKDGTEKTRMEMLLFGRSGTDVDEVLRQAANGGMQKYIDQAEKMGLVLTPAQIEQVHNLGMNINILKDQMEGIAVVIGITLIPVLQSLVTWLGNVLTAILPDIKSLGDFITLLSGQQRTFNLPSGMSGTGGSLGSVENQWRVKNGFTPNARYGEMPSAATGPANISGLPSDVIAHLNPQMELSPLEKDIIGLKDWFTGTFYPWLTGLDWNTLFTDIKTMAGWVGDLLHWVQGLKIDNKSIWADQSGTASGMNLSAPQQNLWDWGTWLTNAVIHPIEDWSGWTWKLDVNAVLGQAWQSTWGSFGENLTAFIQPIQIAFYDLGHGINEGIMSFIDTLRGLYNSVIELINKILGTNIPNGGTGHVVVPKPYAQGGKLSGWSMVGEAGWELIDPTGYVHPHGESISLLGRLKNVKAFGSGGYGDAQAWMAGQAWVTALSGGKTAAAGFTDAVSGAGSSLNSAMSNMGSGMSGGGDAQAAAQAVSEAVIPAVAVVARSGAEMSRASTQATATQLAAQVINRSSLEEMKGIRRDLQKMVITIIAENRKLMAA
jgi:hypothetical protein